MNANGMETTLSRRQALLAALAWQAEAGVDEAIGETALDRSDVADAPSVRAFLGGPQKGGAKGAAAAAGAAAKRGGAPAQARAPKREPDAPATLARRAASEAPDLPALKAAMEQFTGSRLKEGAKHCVFADGDPRARLMAIGEAPGREEDKLGVPFVGRSGQLLDRMLAAIGLSRTAEDPAQGAYISNVVPFRPLENRAPDEAEATAFMPFTLRHIELAAPDVILCLGNTPAKHLMNANAGVTRFRGTWRDVEVGGRTIPALCSFHPAFLLRSPEMKRLAWRDLLALQERLERG